MSMPTRLPVRLRLLAGCNPDGGPAGSGGLAEALRRAWAEVAAAPALLAELEALPPARRFRHLALNRRFANLGFVAHLLEAPAAGAEQVEHRARLALEALALLPEEPTTRALAQDFRARAWVAVAAARARLEDFAGAETALAHARAALARGTGDPLEAARLAEAEALLHRRRGHLPGAVRCARQARDLYAEVGQVPPGRRPEARRRAWRGRPGRWRGSVA